MQGIYVNYKRPKSKKEVKEQVALDASKVRLEATSLFGEYDGLVSEMPMNSPQTFVGPDPYNKRNFYGTITRTEKGIKVT